MDLYTARKTKNLSMQQLAEIVDCDRISIHNYEKGIYYPKNSIRKKLELTLGKIDWIKTFGLSLPSITQEQDHFILSYVLSYLREEDPAEQHRRLQFLNNILKQIKNKNHERITVLHD